MCPMGEISCQIAFYPLVSKDLVGPINRVLDLIEKSGLDYEVSPMSTSIKGEASKVFRVLEAINQYCSQEAIDYSMNLILSNICGL